MNIIGIISQIMIIIMITIFLILVILSFIAYKLSLDKLFKISSITAIIILGLTFSMTIMATSAEQLRYEMEQEELTEKQQQKEAEEFNKKLETYKYMIDGQEVNKDDISLDLYNFVIDDEKEIIFMTGK